MKQYEITMDLPGMKPKEVNLELQNDCLIISGKRTEEKEEKGETFYRVERSDGLFRRVLPLTVPVNSDGIEAKYQEGALGSWPLLILAQPMSHPRNRFLAGDSELRGWHGFIRSAMINKAESAVAQKIEVKG